MPPIPLAAVLVPGPSSPRRTSSLRRRRAPRAHAERTASLSFGDVDQDGHLDLVVANGRHWPAQNRILLNNGEGRFQVIRDLGGDRATSYAAPLADLDGDDDLDAVVGNDRAPNRVFWNDGTGHFEPGPVLGEIASTRSVSLADLDGDGNLDVLVTNRGEPNSIFFNDGSRGFERRGTFGTARDSTIGVAVGDVTGTGISIWPWRTATASRTRSC